MAFNLNITYIHKRWFLIGLLAYFGLSYLPMTKATFALWNQNVIAGIVTFGTVIGLVGLYMIYEVYKKRT